MSESGSQENSHSAENSDDYVSDGEESVQDP